MKTKARSPKRTNRGSSALAPSWPTARLLVGSRGVHAAHATSGTRSFQFDATTLTVLESYITRPSSSAAYRAYRGALAPGRSDIGGLLELLRTRSKMAHSLLVHISGAQIHATPVEASVRGDFTPALAFDQFPSSFAKSLDLTDVSRRHPIALRTLTTARPRAHVSCERLDYAQFLAKSRQLRALGFLHDVPGSIDFGALSPGHPLCPFFGFLRGTPIDRHYLDAFVREFRSRIVGRTLEIGGTPETRTRHRLTRVTRFLTVDADPASQANYVGDVHTSTLFPRARFDTILAFNVLEHCRDPGRVVRNVRAWLKPGGAFLCMVPNAQRIHQVPKDYWRPLPDALEFLTREFGERQFRMYGNLTTTIASLAGASFEDVPPSYFQWHDERYPVATCVVATNR